MSENENKRLFSVPWALESVMMIVVIIGLGHLIGKIIYLGYIPLPFVYDVTDTFMDWYNPAHFAHDGHAYDNFQSIYAPLSFVILKFFGMASCYNIHPKDARDCDWVGIVSIFAFYLGALVLAAIAFYRNQKSTWLFRAVGFGIGLPMLYALERGNLILVSFIFFIVFVGRLVRSPSAVAWAAALMINMKSYLLFPVLAIGIKRDWRLLELCGIATIAVYLITMAWYGGGTPFELMRNLNVWFNAMESVVWDQISYSTTYKPFLQFDIRQYPVRDFIPTWIVEPVKVFISTEVIASRVLAFVCVGLAWLYPKEITLVRLGFFLLMQSFINDNPGGYGQSFIVFMVFMERWTNVRIGTAIVMAYVISIPTDLMFASVIKVERMSWITQRPVDTIYGITWGALFRPAAILIMFWMLMIDSLIDFHRAMRREPPMWGVRFQEALAFRWRPSRA